MGAAIKDNQDFEGYARLKPFNATVAEGWRAAFEEAMARTERPTTELRLLDFGCGDGKYFRFLIERGFDTANIHGVDVSRLRIERCRQQGWANARVLEPGADLPFESGTFDFVNFMEVIEHIPAAEGRHVVAELRRVLLPGGMLLISTPNYPIKRLYDLSAAVNLRKWSRVRDDPTHVTLFNHARMDALLRPHFSKIEARPFKQGFIYRRIARPFFLHKLFFLCQT